MNLTLSKGFLQGCRLVQQKDLAEHQRCIASSGKDGALISEVCFLFQGAAVMMENLPNFVKFLLSGALAGMKQEAFMNRTVREIMWGYEDPLIDTINKLVPGLIPFKGKFGLFVEVSELNTKITAVLVLGLSVWAIPFTNCLEQPCVVDGGCVRLS